MDLIVYALCKKIAASAVSGISDLKVDGNKLIITTQDGQELEMNFPTPEDGVSIINVTIDENNHLKCNLSNETEIDAGEIKTIKGKDGKTPEKGVDYFTDDDIQSIISVINQGDLSNYLKVSAAEETFMKKNDTYTKEEIDSMITGGVDLKDYLKKEEAQEIYASKEDIKNLKLEWTPIIPQ